MTACFICDGPVDLTTDGPREWVTARPACPGHKAAARFPTGEPVDAFLRRWTHDQYPLEGSLLNFVLNPVDVAGRRAWLDFHFESPSLWEEIFPSDSYFQYLVQHRPEFVTVLFEIHRENLVHGELLVGRQLTSAPPKSQLQDYLSILDLWETQWHVDLRLGAGGGTFPGSPDEVLSRLLEDSPSPSSADRPEAIRQLREMARVRFSHLVG